MKHFFLFCALLLAVEGVAAAQARAAGQTAVAAPSEAAAEKQRFPLLAIEIRGNQHFEAEEIIALSGLKVGELIADPESTFKSALERINEAGVFNGLEFRYEPHGDGYRLIYTVDEVDDFYPLRLKGFGVPDEEVLERLRREVPLFSRDVPATGPMVERIGETLQALWEEQGKDSKIDGMLLPAGEEFEMVFQPRGTIKTIALTKFENARVISNLDLQRDFFSAGSGAPYSEERLLELLDYNVRPLYEEKGHLEVKFCPCSAEPDTDTEGLIVTVHVEEGVEYTFGAIELPELGEFDPQKVADTHKARTGEVANMKLVHETVAALDGLLKANGFMNASVDFDKQLETENKTVDVSFEVALGDRYAFSKLAIKGLDLIAEAAVRKRWGMAVGDPYNASYPAFFLNTIVQEGMFDNLTDTGWSMQVNDGRKTVDVELTFR